MKTYCGAEISFTVNGVNIVKTLDIYRDGNTFNAFKYDVNVYSSGWLGMNEYVKDWKENTITLAKNMLGVSESDIHCIGWASEV